VADLLAACLEAGLSVADAAAVVGAAVPGRLGAQLGLAGNALLTGADLSAVWSESRPGAGAWPRLAAALEHGSRSGAPLAGLLRSLADDERDRARWAADAAAQRAGVRAIGPLITCFLPAFVLVGVVPVVVGIAGRVVGDLR
jgi:pilus assembly protein TadC